MVVPKIAVISANLGGIDRNPKHCEQSIPVDYYHFDESNFPLRSCAMTSRMQARIPKVFGWQMAPGYDIYIWVDTTFMIHNSDTVKWMLEKLGDADVACFKHPDRRTIQQECDFLDKKILEKHPYIMPRYADELTNQFLEEIKEDKNYEDNRLFANAIFIYRNNEKIRAMSKDWWYYISRYHINDQLGMPYSLYKNLCKVNVIDMHYMKTDHFTKYGHLRKNT